MSVQDRKIRIFIGSSSKVKYKIIKNKLKEILSKDYGFIVSPWDQPGIFNTGSNILDELRRIAYLSDFAILIFTPDDDILKRTEDNTISIAGSTPRDNVLLEMGLFMGMLGRKRSFC